VIDDVCTILSSLYEYIRSSGDSGGASERPGAVALALSEALESRGDYGGALSLLSVLMKPEDNPGVDPSYIIFRAAGEMPTIYMLRCRLFVSSYYSFSIIVLMQHIGKSSQACEYLEFILDDAPSTHGYGKVHILALMYCSYSTRGVQSSYLADKCETHLQQMRTADLAEALGTKRSSQGTAAVPSENDISGVQRAQLPPLSFRSHALFDALVLQALARSEYVFAAELLKYVRLLFEMEMQVLSNINLFVLFIPSGLGGSTGPSGEELGAADAGRGVRPAQRARPGDSVRRGSIRNPAA
jgi:hypothetical protein